jgi:hypothetical protein
VSSTPAASRAATIFSPASPAVTDNGRTVGEIGCYDLGPCEDRIADDILESMAVDFDAMRVAGAV